MSQLEWVFKKVKNYDNYHSLFKLNFIVLSCSEFNSYINYRWCFNNHRCNVTYSIMTVVAEKSFVVILLASFPQDLREFGNK